MKIVINRCYGGFSLSDQAMREYAAVKGLDLYAKTEYGFTSFYTSPTMDDESYLSCRDFERNDPALVKVVETIGAAANGSHADLKVVDIPDDVDWEIAEYDGIEWVAEKHRTWS